MVLTFARSLLRKASSISARVEMRVPIILRYSAEAFDLSGPSGMALTNSGTSTMALTMASWASLANAAPLAGSSSLRMAL